MKDKENDDVTVEARTTVHPFYALHLSPTGASKQDLSGMGAEAHRNARRQTFLTVFSKQQNQVFFPSDPKASSYLPLNHPAPLGSSKMISSQRR